MPRPAAPARTVARGIVLSLFALLPCLAPAWGQVGSARYSAITVEAGTGRVIAGANPDELRFPASLTKLMTLYMTFEALRDRRVQLAQYVPVSEWAASQPPSRLGLQPGEALTVEQAILGLVTRSANDVAAALGETLGGTEERFAQMMTLRAQGLGMNRSNFRNASGLPDTGQWSTARDLATLGRRLVIDFPQYYGYFAAPAFVWRNRVIPNHDNLLRTYPGADGMKTGFTNYSGHNLVTSAVRGNVRLIGVVLGASSSAERDQHMTMLLDDGFSQARGASLGGLPARVGQGLFSLASGLGMRRAEAASASVAPAGPSPGGPRLARDHAVQMGGFADERAAWDAVQDTARLAPAGQPRVQPLVSGARTFYTAQLLGLTEAEAQAVCASPLRRGAGCRAFRGAGQMAQQ